MMGGGHQMWGGMVAWVILVWIFLLALTALVIAATIWLVRSWRIPPEPRRSPMGPARAQLDLRYARGEMEREEYLRRKRDLSEGGY